MERLLDLAAAGARHRLRRDTAAKPDPAGRLSVQERDHLSGFSSRWNTTAATTSPCSTWRWTRSANHAFLKEEQPGLRAAGRHVGIGVACYVEGTGIGPYEGAKVQIQTNGRVSVATGIGTQGQGHFTVFAPDRSRPTRRGCQGCRRR